MTPAFRGKSGEFVYYLHDASAAFRFQLTGDLSGERTQDLEQARLTAGSIIGRRCLTVDLTGLRRVDASGCELLRAWQALGAQMTVLSGEEQARIQSMTGIPVAVVGAKPGDSRWLARRAAALLLAAFLALLFAATAVAGNSALKPHGGQRGADKQASAGIRALISGLGCVDRGVL